MSAATDIQQVPEGFRMDAKGRLIPEAQIKEIDQIRDELVLSIVDRATELRDQLRDFKADVFSEIAALIETSAQEYDVQIGGKKGNVQLVSFCGRYKVLRAISETITFDERLQAAKGLIEDCLRDWTTDRHQKMDDRPFGGGPGMILMVEPVVKCVREVRNLSDDPGQLILLTPQGETWNQQRVEGLAGGNQRFLLLCGRYEGIDQRVIDKHAPLEVSVGDYVLSGGETGALVLLDAIIRLLPGVMGNELSGTDESFEDGLLEHPHYTRPAEWQGRTVPSVLLSGDHKAIARWRAEEAREITAARRPDLLDQDTAAAAEPVSTERKRP